MFFNRIIHCSILGDTCIQFYYYYYCRITLIVCVHFFFSLSAFILVCKIREWLLWDTLNLNKLYLNLIGKCVLIFITWKGQFINLGSMALGPKYEIEKFDRGNFNLQKIRMHFELILQDLWRAVLICQTRDSTQNCPSLRFFLENLVTTELTQKQA